VSSSSTVCRSSAGVCDTVENCTGVADQGCPADSVQGAFVVCRSAAGECDATENCDGVGVNCPADAKDPLNTPCTADSNVCTRDICDGAGNTCTHPAGNAGTLCRAAAGICDVVETCNGVSTTCPADAKEPASTVCRPTAGICDTAENCTGSGDNCPADGFQPSTTSAGLGGRLRRRRDCPGISANCPGDGFLPSSSRSAAPRRRLRRRRELHGHRSGLSGDAFQPATTVCRVAVGACDIAEQCTGSGAACPADARRRTPTTTPSATRSTTAR
jgi:hypothetical protein